MFKSGVSLRYKILIALTVLPFIGLLVFLLLAVKIFEKDKIAYIFDSSLSASKTKAARARSEVSSVISVVQSVVYSYKANTRTLDDAGIYFFNQESKFEAFQLYALSPETGDYENVVTLQKPELESRIADQDKRADRLLQQAVEKSVVVRPGTGRQSIILALRFGDVTDKNHVIALATFQALEFSDAFKADGGMLSFLTHGGAQRIFGPENIHDGGWGIDDISTEISGRGVPEGIAEITSPDGREWLVSFVEVGVGDMQVVSVVDRTMALQAVSTLLRTSVLFFLLLISSTVIIGVLASHKLTSALRRLLSATQKVASGDFNVRVEVKARDEIGTLATSFNVMAREVSRLLSETADKARMESELATARTVQETLFPENIATLGPVRIAGHYQPASECGGDWWYYCENGGKVYIWIGDATGHGAPAALLTSAARAVASVIQGGPPIGPGQAMSILNRAIHDASKGKMMMTFFLGVIDKETGQMEYANASHEAPLLLKRTDDVPSRSDYVPLNDVNNPRLGERPGIEFKQASVQLEEGDRIVFYTDGVVDVKDVEKKAWGERRFLKALSKEFHEKPRIDVALEGVLETIGDFRQQTPLDDDVTLILCSYRGAA